ncbi:MAG: hypothetical protein ACRD44_15855, partial [Bryobacteraceae bacterium]
KWIAHGCAQRRRGGRATTESLLAQRYNGSQEVLVIRNILLGILLAGVSTADTLTLKNGKSVDGTFLSGDAREIRMAVGSRVETYAINEVNSIRFGSATQALATPSAPVRKAVRSSGRTVPAGSEIVVRMIDDIDSERDRVGQTFRASLDEPVIVDGQTILNRGVDVTVKLVDDKQAGRLTGRTELTLDLVSITVDGSAVEVASSEVKQASESRTTQTAKRTGGLAAAGAVIGAIAGGGKGAAIGAAAGAGAGAGVQVLTKGPKVKLPSESRLSFTLQQPAQL